MPSASGSPSGSRRGLWVPIAAFVLGTVCLNALAIWSAVTSVPEAPWRDQWPFFEDAPKLQLWASYWGHRPVITRLATLLDIHLFSGLATPVVLLTLAIHLGHLLLLAWIMWRLFGRRGRRVLVLLLATVFHLGLSALQMENFVWPAQISYLLAAASATAAFFALAQYTKRPRAALAVGAVGFAVLGSLADTNCLLIWPLLLVEAWVLRIPLRIRWPMAGAAAVFLALYFYGYEAGPRMGMGAARAILHPEQSIPVLGVLIAGPISVVSVPAGKVAGVAALCVALYALVAAARRRGLMPPGIAALAAMTAFQALTLAMLVVSRISPEFIEERLRLHLLVLPSRYFSATFLFWLGLLGIVAWLVLENRRQWPLLVPVVAVTGVLTAGTVSWQIGEAGNWRAFLRELDVAATALIVNVEDPGNPALAQIYADVPLRTRVNAWLREKRLSIYHERRGSLLGGRVQRTVNGGCEGQVQSAVRAGDAFRIGGWARPSRDLVFADAASGRIVGLARTGLRRPDLAGKVSGSLGRIGFQGYVRPGSGGTVLYGVLDEPGSYCRIAELPPLAH